jgi:hypothetical protein
MLNYGMVTRLTSLAGMVAFVIYFILCTLALFGVGWMGRNLSEAAREDEGDSWNRR